MYIKLGQFPLSLLVDFYGIIICMKLTVYWAGLEAVLTNVRSTFFSLKKKSLILETSLIEMPPSCCRFAVSLQAFHAMLALLLATSGLLPFTTQLIGLAVGQLIVSDFVSRWDWCVMMGGLKKRSIISVLRITSSNRNGFFFLFFFEGGV